jgi:hypothetical protein
MPFSTVRGIDQIGKPVLSVTLEPCCEIGAFRIRVVSRLSGTAEIQGNSVRVGPWIELLRRELAALANSDRHRQLLRLPRSLQSVDDTATIHVSDRNVPGRRERHPCNLGDEIKVKVFAIYT